MQHITIPVLIFICAFLFPSPVLADVAPPNDPPGSSIDPGGDTNVQMMSERVIINVWPFTSLEQNRVKVTADFLMRNQGKVDETLLVRFPLTDPSGKDNGYSGYPEIQNFGVQVNSEWLATITTTPNPIDNTASILWASFYVSFPVGEDIPIHVVYDHSPWGIYPWAQIKYILETGRGWYGAIGTADIILRLPYRANDTNVDLSETTRGGKFVGNEMQWHWENIEPERSDNVVITILYPVVWNAILQAQADSESDPKNVQALISLSSVYRDVATEKHGFVAQEQLALLSQKVIEQAIQIEPNSADLHAELADNILWQNLPGKVQDPNFCVSPSGKQILNEIEIANNLEPDNKKLQTVIKSMKPWCNIQVPGLITSTSTPSLSMTSTIGAEVETATLTNNPKSTSTPYSRTTFVATPMTENSRSASVTKELFLGIFLLATGFVLGLVTTKKRQGRK